MIMHSQDGLGFFYLCELMSGWLFCLVNLSCVDGYLATEPLYVWMVIVSEPVLLNYLNGYFLYSEILL